MSDPGDPKPDPKPSLRSAMRDLVEGRGPRQGHPDIEDLLAYAERRLEGERAESLRDHLATCPDCAKLVLDFKAFSKDVDAQDAQAEPSARAEAAWWELQSRIQGEEKKEDAAAGEPVADVQPRRRGPRTASRASWQRFALPLAAAVLFAAVGLGILNHQRGPSLIELQANQEVSDRTKYLIGNAVEAEAPGTERGVVDSAEDGTELSAQKDYSLGLPLPSEALHRHAGYRYEVVNAEGKPISTRGNFERKSGLEGDSGEGFTLELKRELLPPGHYTIWVYGVDAGSQKPIAFYPIQVTE